MVLLLHILHFCTHQNHDMIGVSRFEAHKRIWFHAPFAIKSCYDIAFDEYYYPCNSGWLVYVMAIIYEFNLEFEHKKIVGVRLMALAI